MSDGIEMMLGEIKGDLKALREETSDKFTILFTKIDGIHERGCSFGNVTQAHVKAHGDRIDRMESGFFRGNALGVAGGTAGFGTTVLAGMWLVAKWKGWL